MGRLTRAATGATDRKAVAPAAARGALAAVGPGDGGADAAGSRTAPPGPDRGAGVPGAQTRRHLPPGPARALAAAYALFAMAAVSRSAVQLATRPGEAPFAYALSGVAGLIYLAGTLALRRSGPRARRVALVVCTVELAGVLVVGTLSAADGSLFPDASVWSGYGAGYGHVPLVLPLLGLWWLRSSR